MTGKEDIRHWRARAVECRTMRMQIKSPRTRQRLLEAARCFEEMADRAEVALKPQELKNGNHIGRTA